MYQCQMGKQVHYTVRFIIDRICIFPFKLILTTFKSYQVYLILSLLSLFGPSCTNLYCVNLFPLFLFDQFYINSLSLSLIRFNLI